MRKFHPGSRAQQLHIRCMLICNSDGATGGCIGASGGSETDWKAEFSVYDFVWAGSCICHETVVHQGSRSQRPRRAQLNGPLRCSLVSLQALLRNAQPRWVPFQTSAKESAVLYADAFFELGDKSYGLSNEPPESWFSTSSRRYKNGWGFVVRRGSVVRFAHGTVPADVLGLFTSRRVFIYCLEFGDFRASHCGSDCSDLLPTLIGFCDNTAGRSALVRGYGRDATINNLLACSGRWPNFLGGSLTSSGGQDLADAVRRRRLGQGNTIGTDFQHDAQQLMLRSRGLDFRRFEAQAQKIALLTKETNTAGGTGFGVRAPNVIHEVNKQNE